MSLIVLAGRNNDGEIDIVVNNRLGGVIGRLSFLEERFFLFVVLKNIYYVIIIIIFNIIFGFGHTVFNQFSL